MRILHRVRAVPMFTLALALGLSACGGGGGGSTNTSVTPPSTALPASSTLANVCTVEGEKKFVRSYIDENYLWYREVPTVNAATYTSVVDYFKALLVKTLDSNGLPKDQFSFAISNTDADSMSTGVNAGYGMEWAYDTQGRLRVALVAAGSPAAVAGMARGGHMVRVNNYNVNSWYPNTAGAWVDFQYSDTPGGTQRTIRLDARTVTEDPVPLTTIVTSPGGKRAGYMLFNAHTQGAQDKLITATRSLQGVGVNELVLDVRYNGGGYLYIAGSLSSMISNSAQSGGKVFEALRYNDKRTADSNDSIYRFPNAVEYSEGTYPVGYTLPRLGLKRVYVLTSDSTCSASESVINGLRGIDVEVVLVGQTTCGKPYGFTRKSNCALSYYPIEFQGINAKGFGDFSAGFAATCAANDDLDRPLGNIQEGQLASALYHLDNNKCAPATALSQVLSTRKALADSSPEADGMSLQRPALGKQLR